uniref:C-type lectin domain-containing protein n=1 Tax=Caenorhabditis tropicalis TaxID=1561998 RepID=A0A1I7TGV3_9PELO
MKWISLIFLFHLLNSTSGCLKYDTCSCKDFNRFSFYPNDPQGMFYTKYEGCRANITCFPSVANNPVSTWGVIPKQADSVYDNFWLVTYGINSNTSFGYVDYYEYFGLFCQDGKWYATKYPNGIMYINTDYDYKYLYENGELDGTISEVLGARCSRP